MTTLNVYNLKGEKSGTAKFETVPGQKLNIKLLIQAVNVWQSNHRRGLAKAMTRGESSKTTAKWYRQKHTGRARHGSKSAPIFVGGGVAHGPTGQQNYHRVTSKKMAHGAFVSALIAKADQGGVMVVSGLEKLEPKTKAAINLLSKLGLSEKKVLFAPEKKAVNIRDRKSVV